MRTTLIAFRLCAPDSTRVELYGSWDAFTAPYKLERDRRKGPGEFVGIFDFHNALYDGSTYSNMGENETPKQQTGLQQGGTYHYYYSLDGMTEHFNPSQPTTTACPMLPGQVLNVCEVPSERPSGSASANAILRSDESHSWWTLNPRDRFAKMSSQPRTAASGSIRISSPVQSDCSGDASSSLTSPMSKTKHTLEQPRSPTARSIRSFIRSTFKAKSRASSLPADQIPRTAPSPESAKVSTQFPSAPQTADPTMAGGSHNKSLPQKSRDGPPFDLFRSLSRRTSRRQLQDTTTSPPMSLTIPTMADQWKAQHPVEPEVQAPVPATDPGRPNTRKQDSVMFEHKPEPSNPVAQSETTATTLKSREAAKPQRISIPTFAPLPQFTFNPQPTDKAFRPQLLRSAFSAWTDTTGSPNTSSSPLGGISEAPSARLSLSDYSTARPSFLAAAGILSKSSSMASFDEDALSRHSQTYGSPRDCNSPGPLIMSKGTTTATSFGSPVLGFNSPEVGSPKFMLADSYIHSGSLDDLLQSAASFSPDELTSSKSEVSTMLGPASAVTNMDSKGPSSFVTPIFVEKSTKRLCQYAGLRDKPMQEAFGATAQHTRENSEEVCDYFSCKDSFGVPSPTTPYRPFNQALEEERELDELRHSVSDLLKIVHPHYFNSSRPMSGTRTPGRLPMGIPAADDDFAEEFSFLRLVVN